MGLFDIFKSKKSKAKAPASEPPAPFKEADKDKDKDGLHSCATTTSIDSNLDTAEETHGMISSCPEGEGDQARDQEKESVPASIQDYEVVRELGRGATAVVQLGRKKSSVDSSSFAEAEELVALKVYKTSLLKRMRDIKRIGRRMVVSTGLDKVQKEIAIMKKLRHRHLLNLCEVFDDDADTLVLMLEYAPHGQVMDWNSKERKYQPNPKLLQRQGSQSFDEQELRRFVRELLLGLEYLHNNSICHRDLKPENILVAEDGSCKIADFGVAHLFEDEDQERADNNNQSVEQKKKSGMVTSTAGTYAFMAPETLAGGAFDAYKADVWALGITFFALIFGRIPYYDPDVVTLFEKIQEEDLVLPEDTPISDSLRDLLLGLLDKNVETRLTITQAKHHPWVVEDLSPQEKNEFLSIETEKVQVDDHEIASAVTRVTSLNVMVRVKLGANKWKRKAFAARDRRLQEEKAQSLEEKAPSNGTVSNDNQVDA